jgi:two-component system nitrogen regulation response regulator GlnG
VKVDVRVIAATHQDLETLVREGKFREDLFHRINVIRVRIPPLRERAEDIPLLMRHFLAQAGRELKTEPKRLLPEVLERLQAFDWPGNVRQLENTCRWLTVMAPGQDVHLDDLPPELRDRPRAAEAIRPVPAEPVVASSSPSTLEPGDGGSWSERLREWAASELRGGRSDLLDEATPTFERIMIEVALEACHGQRQEAARRLGWGRNTLTRKIKELGME